MSEAKEARELSREEEDNLQRSAKKVKAAALTENGTSHQPAPKVSFRDAMMGDCYPGEERHDELGSLETDDGLIHVSTMKNWSRISLSDRFKRHIRQQW